MGSDQLASAGLDPNVFNFEKVIHSVLIRLNTVLILNS